VKKYAFRIPNVSAPVLVFSPGVFFILLGLVTVFFPRLILLVVALVFAFVGLGLSFLAWKIYQARKKFEQIAKQFQGIQVQAMKVHPQTVVEESDDSITFH
jgi:LPS O-antigen subunit length determinant protein (WzzB/FepE family)